MLPILSADQIRQAEESFWAHNPGVDLMARAASAVADHARAILGTRPDPGTPVVVVAAGAGNNAGDALLAAAELDATVLVWAVADQTHPAGLREVLKTGGHLVSRVEALEALTEAALVIDGVAGIGSRRGLSESVEQFAAEARRRRVPVLAVDVPSGLAADRPSVSAPAFRAERTVTFIAHKLCQVATPAAHHCGEVHLVDIGVPYGDPAIWQVAELDLAAWYPWPAATSDKYSRGVVGLDTGSPRFPGAALLGAAGALFTGAGMVRHAGAEWLSDRVVQRWPSVVPGPGRVQAWVVGSGWQVDEEHRDTARARLAELAADGVPMVIDAGALEVLPHSLPEGSLLTPHAGELARLLGIDRAQVDDDPVRAARAAAGLTGATVLLKGGTEYIAEPDGRVLLAVRGPAWAAQAGSGDVLAGACGALMAAGVRAPQAAAVAASLQALAGVSYPGPRPPELLAQTFPDIISGWAAATDRAPSV
ncbi:bifunctional ADP-dependent NAD(P)H-hydrate dehydratase/NAD(P)H-hydrate epimerase [Aestuariimicrobium sp. Y1814]|uniref:bifunctional ADP-dependent NAD(P)H-hydrate dehydratase/NAD(P)H-hydrate epimerase n=1 Tax=Aestuariimicrobium sp. Y1814 TaxID=3418742 RepID=UPI003DA6F44C